MGRPTVITKNSLKKYSGIKGVKWIAIAAALPILVIIVGNILSSTFLNADKYSSIIEVPEAVFEEDKGGLAERITDDESANEPAILSDRLALQEAIGRMPPLWRKILLLRYYRDRTQQQTADLLGLSQVKVSREEKKILAFLRGEMIV